MPLLTSQVPDMDKARMDFIDKLNAHIGALKEELRISELILASVVKSLSDQSAAMKELDEKLHKERQAEARHKPLIETPNAPALLQVEETIRRAVRMNRLGDEPVKTGGEKIVQVDENNG